MNARASFTPADRPTATVDTLQTDRLAAYHQGTAHILPDDDPRQRLRWLKRPVNDAFLLLIGTQQLTIRVDLKATERRPCGP